MRDTKKRIAVTGAHGKLGRVVVRHLNERGYDVFAIDQGAGDSLTEPYMKVDLTDFGQTLDALSSTGAGPYRKPQQQAFDVVVHLASVPATRMIPDAELFRNNMMAAYNVFESCRRLGITDIVWSASETAVGLPLDRNPPPYVPVDEESPIRGTTAYSIGKVLGEELARQVCLNDPAMRITCLRFSNIMLPEEYAKFDAWQDDPAIRAWNLWSYIDARDAAQAVEKAVEHDVRGQDVFFITNDETVMRTPTAALLDRIFPDIERRKTFEKNDVLQSNAKAKRVLGFRPQHRWTDGN